MPQRIKTNQCSEIKLRIAKINNLTSDKHYRTKAERKQMWKLGVIPPAVVAEYRRVNFTVLEAGCAYRSDGLWKILDFLLEHPIGHFDVIVSSGGLHCSYKQYRASQWYLSLEKRWKRVTETTPVVWLEITNCLKTDAGHYWRYGTSWRLNYRKYVSCAYATKHVPGINSVFQRSGVFISPTRFISSQPVMTANPYEPPSEKEAESPCVFADYLHPSISCYLFMMQVHFISIRIALTSGTYVAGNGSNLKDAALSLAEDGLVVEEAGWWTWESMLWLLVAVLLSCVVGRCFVRKLYPRATQS